MTSLTAFGLKGLAKMSEGWEGQDKMPVLFVGHGNPMNALYENDITKGWRNMAGDLQPRAILCISAHWETRGTYVTMAPNPRTIHDFGGFPKALFDVQYPAPGAPEVAREVIDVVTSRSVEEDHEWGLDHGTWSVLIKMFPEADVPVFQMSLDHYIGPREHFELGEQLSKLRRRGVLIVGSGNIVHNLGMAKWDSNEPYDWAVSFDQKVKEKIEGGDLKSLADIGRMGREAQLSIPTAEHYLPMMYTLGLKDEQDEVRFFNEQIDMGSMSMRSFVIS